MNAVTMTEISLTLILETQASTYKSTKVFKDREEKKKHSTLSINAKKDIEETQAHRMIQ